MAEITAEVGAKRKRIPEISFLNILLCVLVVFIHSSSEPVSSLDKSTLSWAICFIPWRLSAFAVQGFLLLSGVKLFLGQSKSQTSYPAFIAKRFRTVFLPYALWVVVYYIYFLRLRYFDFSLIDLASYIVKGDLVGHFYFVIAIMQFYLLMPLWRRIVSRYSAASALTAALLVTVVWRSVSAADNRSFCEGLLLCVQRPCIHDVYILLSLRLLHRKQLRDLYRKSHLTEACGDCFVCGHGRYRRHILSEGMARRDNRTVSRDGTYCVHHLCNNVLSHAVGVTLFKERTSAEASFENRPCQLCGISCTSVIYILGKRRLSRKVRVTQGAVCSADFTDIHGSLRTLPCMGRNKDFNQKGNFAPQERRH